MCSTLGPCLFCPKGSTKYSLTQENLLVVQSQSYATCLHLFSHNGFLGDSEASVSHWEAFWPPANILFASCQDWGVWKNCIEPSFTTPSTSHR